MKYTCKPRHQTFVFCLSILTATLFSTPAHAQLFDNGTVETNSTPTTYNSSVVIGSENPGNGLVINNGATVSAPDVLMGDFSSSSNNLLSVQDNALFLIGDTTTNGLTTGGIVVGDSSKTATLDARNNATIETDYLYIGLGTNDSGSVKLSGAESEFNISQDAYVGDAGSTNSIDLSEGASLNIEGTLNVGSGGGSNNHVNIHADSSLSLNTTNQINVANPEDNDNSISIKQNGTLKIGGDVDTATLEELGVDLAKKSTLQVGGILEIENDSLDTGINIVLDHALSTNTAHWQANSQTFVYIGETTSDNTLTLTNGATAHSERALRLGNNTASHRNKISVGGSNSVFTVEQSVIVGGKGDNNQINVNDYGQATFLGNLTLGKDSTATGNEVNVGSNGVVNISGTTVIGDAGNNNSFAINYGTVNATNDFIVGSGSIGNRYNQIGGTNTVAGAFIIGKTEDATGKTGHVDDNSVETTGNLAIVGKDAALNIQQNLTVGQEGGGSILTIRDGGTVNVDGDVAIGEAVKDNYIYLQRDADTRFNVTGDLVVGKEGGSNRFAVYGGTANIDGNLYLGGSTNQHEVKNFIHLQTTNAVLNVANAIYIGASNSLNTLDLVGGATANAQDLFVGIDGGISSNNVVTISGADSRLNIQNSVTVGAGGNTLKAVNDAWLVVGEFTTTNLPSSTGGALAVGSTNGTPSLIVHENSSVEAGYIYIGVGTNQTGDILVTGSNSLLKATSDIVVGLDGSDNALNLENGGTAEGNLLIGKNGGANDNLVNLSGSNTLLTASGLAIGAEDNSGNMLNLTNGATFILAGDLNIATSNALNLNRGATFHTDGDFDLVSQSTNGFNFNGGSTLEVGGTLTATNVVEGERNLVLDGGRWILGTNLVIGANTDSNSVSVIGAGAELTATRIGIGSTNSAGNILLIEDGGFVSIDESLIIADGNTLNLSSNGTLEVIGDFNALAPSADNFIFGSNATLRVGGTITTSTNQNTIQSGQTIVLDGGLSTNHTAYWNIGTDLYVGGSLGSGSLEVLTSGIVENVSAFIGNADSNTVKIAGSGAAWNISSNLTVGVNGNDNLLNITDGATVTVSNNAYVGVGPSSNNTVTVSGLDSSWSILQDLMIGDGGLSNRLDVWNGAAVFVGNDLNITNGSTLLIGTGSVVSVEGNYEQDGTSRLEIVAGPTSAGLLDVAKDANFASNATIFVRSDGSLDTNDFFKTTIVMAGDNLFFGGDTASSNNIDAVNFAWDGLISGVTNYVEGTQLIIEGSANSLSSVIGVKGTGTQLEGVVDEIDALATDPDSAAANMRVVLGDLGQPANTAAMDNYYGEKASSSPMHNLVNQGLGGVASSLTLRGDNTRERAGAASASINWNKPNGVAGPHTQGQELQGWIAGYGSQGKKSASDGYGSYDLNLTGFIIGADLAISQNILLGLAGGSNNGSIDKENNGTGDSKTTYGALYSSIGTKSWFMDGSLIYGSSQIDQKLGDVFDTTSEYDAMNLAFYLGGGKEFTGDYLIVTPQASLLVNYYEQDAYDEESTGAEPRSIDAFDALYVQSSIGCNLGVYSSMGNLTLKPELRAHWLHEFNASEETLPYRLVGGNGTSYNMILQAPEEDILKLGAGVSAKMSDYLELRADLDTRLGSGYSDYTLFGSLRYQF